MSILIYTLCILDDGLFGIVFTVLHPVLMFVPVFC